MKKLIIAAAIAALLALGLLATVAGVARQLAGPTYDPLAEARARQALAQAEALAPLDVALAAAWRVLPLVALTGGLVYLASLGVAHVARFRHERTADARGLLPVSAQRLGDAGPAALASYHAAHIAAAQRPHVPHSLSYAPHTNYRADAGRAALPLAHEPAHELAAVPSFAQLLNAGRVGRGNPMLLGFDAEGRPVEGSWLDLYSCAVGGLSGSGKTWTATFLAAQAALYGAELVLLDPHAGNAESLAQRLAPMRSAFRCAPAERPREMLAAVHLVLEELARRKAGGRGPGLLFIADEFSALQRGELADPLAALVEALGQEGRKLGIYAMVAGQVWSGSRAGGTELRDSLASAYVHRLRPSQARMLTGMAASDLPADLLELPAGAAYLLDTAGDFRRVTIPQMGPADVARVASLLGDGAAAPGYPQATEGRVITPPLEAWRKPEGSLREASLDQATTAAGRGGAPPAEAQRAAALFLAGQDLAAVVFALRGVKSSEGRRYQAAAGEVQALLRAALGQAERGA